MLQQLAGSRLDKYEPAAAAAEKFAGFLLAAHEPVYVLALGAAAEVESAALLVLSVGVQAEHAAEAFFAHEASAALEAFCVLAVSVVLGASAVLEVSAVPEPSAAPAAAVAKVAPAAAAGVCVLVAAVLSAAVAPVAVAHCTGPAASTADLEMAAEPGMWGVADVQQQVAEQQVGAAAHIAAGLLAGLHEAERRVEQIVEPHSSPSKDQESC